MGSKPAAFTAEDDEVGFDLVRVLVNVSAMGVGLRDGESDFDGAWEDGESAEVVLQDGLTASLEIFQRRGLELGIP